MKKTFMMSGIIGVVFGASMVYAGSLTVTDNLARLKAKNPKTQPVTVTVLVDGTIQQKVLDKQADSFHMDNGPMANQKLEIKYNSMTKDISKDYLPYAGKQHSFITMYQHSDTKWDTHCHGANGKGGHCVQNFFLGIDVLLAGCYFIMRTF